MTKGLIEQNIKNFNNKSLLDSSLELFETLGYKTKRLYTIESKEDFKNKFLTNSFDENKSLYPEWNDIKFLFEARPDDLSSEDTTISIGVQDDKVIETYWFISIELNGDNYSKRQLSDITREINKQKPIPVFILFKYGNKLTFSIIDRRLNKKDENKDVLEKVVLIKDINIEKPHRAHIDILNDISFEQIQNKYNVSNFVELHLNWLKALSVTELNKKFYTELSNWFFWMLDTCNLSKDGKYQDDVMFGIRMITRIIFNWFIKEKGLVNEKLFERNTYIDILKPEYQEQGDLYYKVILQNLFFGCLSKPMDRREFRSEDRFQGKNTGYDVNNLFRYAKYLNDKQSLIDLFKNIPFLNGGLFECTDDKRNGKYIDCFTDNETKNFLNIPDEIFFLEEPKTIDISKHFEDDRKYKRVKVRGLYTILNSYKFTIDETTPVEEEIALDPELLGRVFENLLAAHNPETKTTARKSTGSYYTPREIVDYMCEQALINYLKTKVENLNIENLDDKLIELLSYSEVHSFTEYEVDELIKAINEVKILDPACGSGAFPMGLLHKLVHVLSKLDPHNIKWKESQIEKINQSDIIEAKEEAIRIIEEQFNDNELNYSRKLCLIQNCIFGVDIQPMATQISRLRFFISLIVDEKPNKLKHNMGILALPNLETKFVAANTLIDLPQTNLFSTYPSLVSLKNELEKVRAMHFRANSGKKKIEIQNKDREIREKIRQESIILGATMESAAQLADWSPYDKDKSSDWFNPKWMFNVDKFDIVIGNPPYLESRHKSFSEEMKTNYLNSTKSRWGDFSIYFSKGCDLLIYFFELSLYLLKENGINAFITQNAWLDTEYGKKFQTFLSNTIDILGIIDSDYKYFDSSDGPNINTIITFFKNSKNKSDKLIFSRCKANFGVMSFPLSKMNQFDETVVSYKEYRLSDSKIKKLKWGLLLYTDKDILEIIDRIFEKGKYLENYKNVKFGQGLNLSKSQILDDSKVENYNFSPDVKIPFLSKESTFNVSKLDTFLINEKKTDSSIKKQLEKNNIGTYNLSNTTKKPPILTMPRGIGGKHFCAVNSLKAYTDSYVDVYDNDNVLRKEEKMNLWCYFNSTICWLIREISGRKNLGGGMLKAEAIDLSYFPCYFEFNKKEQILEIFEKISNRQVLNALDEIETQEHKEIDKIVFDYLAINDIQRKLIIDKFKENYFLRCKKSQT